MLIEQLNNIRYWIVKNIYGDHNKSRKVKKNLKFIIDEMPDDFEGLNVGAGHTKLHPNIKNMEIDENAGADIVGRFEEIPVEDNYFDLLISQEVIEHVEDPFKAINEAYRVLKIGGLCYTQVPFIIGYHPCPHDYWRFTKEGIVTLVESAGFEVVNIDVSVGPAVGFYRIAVEFLAILFSMPLKYLYLPSKLLFSILLFPIKLIDPLLSLNPQFDRISGGYIVVARKVK